MTKKMKIANEGSLHFEFFSSNGPAFTPLKSDARFFGQKRGVCRAAPLSLAAMQRLKVALEKFCIFGSEGRWGRTCRGHQTRA